MPLGERGGNVRLMAQFSARHIEPRSFPCFRASVAPAAASPFEPEEAVGFEGARRWFEAVHGTVDVSRRQSVAAGAWSRRAPGQG